MSENTANTPILVTLGTNSSNYDAGAYRAIFVEYEGPITGEPTKYTDGKPSIFYKFVFEDDDGKTHIGFCDHPKSGRPKIGKKPNKWGRWLAGLGGKPLSAECTITPSDYYGKAYTLIYAPNTNGNVSLSTFTPVK